MMRWPCKLGVKPSRLAAPQRGRAEQSRAGQAGLLALLAVYKRGRYGRQTGCVDEVE